MARTKIEISVDKVAQLAGLGLTQRQIADYFGVSVDTLGRRQNDDADFAAAIKYGRAKANANVANALYDKATKDKDATAIIWYEKTRAGKADKIDVRIGSLLENEIDKMLDYLAENLPGDVYRLVLDTLAKYNADSSES